MENRRRHEEQPQSFIDDRGIQYCNRGRGSEKDTLRNLSSSSCIVGGEYSNIDNILKWKRLTVKKETSS